MLKKLLITNLILYMTLSPVLAVDKIGNEVNEQEFPQSEEVLPKNEDKTKSQKVKVQSSKGCECSLEL